MFVLALVLGVALLAMKLYQRLYRPRTRGPEPPNTSWTEKGSHTLDEEERAPGDWKPASFTYPAFNPDTEFDILTTKAPAYRPFRWGPNYFITMGIRNMEWDEWLQLDNRFPAYHAIKLHRMATQGDNMVRTLPASSGIPSGTLAAKELVHEMAEYLSRRFPQVYSVVRKPHVSDDFGWYGEGEIRTITITPLVVTYDLSVDDPMSVAGLLVQDDLALMLEGSDGRYYFQAGSICLPGFWKLIDKIGLPLEEIHIRGKVPQYEQKLMHSMARFFTKMRVSKPVTRNNYFIQVVNPTRADSMDPDELGWSDTTNGPEDAFDQATKQPTLAAQASGQINFQPPQPSHDVRDVRFRTERQSLRRLPRSGAIVFTVRTYIDPIVELAEEPGVPGRLASGIRSWPEDVASYKGLTLYRDVTLPYLDECHARQVVEGICVDGQSQTNYPF